MANVVQKGRRTEDLGQGEPLCKEEFIKYFTSDECPPYRRILFTLHFSVCFLNYHLTCSTCYAVQKHQGLTETVAKQTWIKKMGDPTVRKDQVPANDMYGNNIGLAA